MSIYKVKAYDKDRDYSNEIREAAKNKNYTQAASLEKLRNQKIAGERLNYPKTYDYIDIGNEIQGGMQNQIGADDLGDLLRAREYKADTNSALKRFGDDEIQRKGWQFYYNAKNGVGGNMENRPKYENRYKERLDELLAEVTGNDKFSYNVETDPLYAQYREQYAREGERAMNDTLDAAAQRAGGMNSYAVSAAAQARNYYNQQLADKIPELYSLAYDKFLSEKNSRRQDLAALRDAENADYNKYLSDMGIFDNDAQRAMNMYNNHMNEKYNERNWDYNVRSNAINNVLQKVQMGYMPTDKELEASGYTKDDLAEMVKNFAAERELDMKSRTLSNDSAVLSNEAARLRNEALERELTGYVPYTATSSKSSKGGKSSKRTKTGGYEFEDDEEKNGGNNGLSLDQFDEESIKHIGIPQKDLSDDEYMKKLQKMVDSGELRIMQTSDGTPMLNKNGKAILTWGNTRRRTNR